MIKKPYISPVVEVEEQCLNFLLCLSAFENEDLIDSGNDIEWES